MIYYRESSRGYRYTTRDRDECDGYRENRKMGRDWVWDEYEEEDDEEEDEE